MNSCPRTREHANLSIGRGPWSGSLLPPLGCGYPQGASKLANFKAPFGRTIEQKSFHPPGSRL